nr:proline-rich protein 36-like [Penaeus vannamei]
MPHLNGDPGLECKEKMNILAIYHLLKDEGAKLRTVDTKSRAIRTPNAKNKYLAGIRPDPVPRWERVASGSEEEESAERACQSRCRGREPAWVSRVGARARRGAGDGGRAGVGARVGARVRANVGDRVSARVRTNVGARVGARARPGVGAGHSKPLPGPVTPTLQLPLRLAATLTPKVTLQPLRKALSPFSCPLRQAPVTLQLPLRLTPKALSPPAATPPHSQGLSLQLPLPPHSQGPVTLQLPLRPLPRPCHPSAATPPHSKALSPFSCHSASLPRPCHLHCQPHSQGLSPFSCHSASLPRPCHPQLPLRLTPKALSPFSCHSASLPRPCHPSAATPPHSQGPVTLQLPLRPKALSPFSCHSASLPGPVTLQPLRSLPSPVTLQLPLPHSQGPVTLQLPLRLTPKPCHPSAAIRLTPQGPVTLQLPLRLTQACHPSAATPSLPRPITLQLPLRLTPKALSPFSCHSASPKALSTLTLQLTPLNTHRLTQRTSREINSKARYVARVESNIDRLKIRNSVNFATWSENRRRSPAPLATPITRAEGPLRALSHLQALSPTLSSCWQAEVVKVRSLQAPEV